MKEQEKNKFADHYRELELSDLANWDEARANYRKLVHVWHPDKFTRRPKEKVYAQQQFIKLTKSYNELRNFYREYDRLPFQAGHISNKKHTKPQVSDDHHPGPEHQSAEAGISAHVFRREPGYGSHADLQGKKQKRIAWIMASGALLMATVTFFYIADRNASQAVAERGREIVKKAPASDFMPNAKEIRRSQTRGAFVKPTQ